MNALVGTTMRLSGVSGPLIGGFIAEGFGYRASFICASVTSVASTLIACSTMPKEDPKPPSHAVSSSTSPKEDDSSSTMAIIKKHWKPLTTAGIFSFFQFVLRASNRFVFPVAGLDMDLSPSEVSRIRALIPVRQV